ncbi:hypothetical protein [Mycobacterium sp.]|nr:hypothetical protein [Mycobacterium sp.]
MIEYPPLTASPPSTVEADLVDWVDQHQPVSFPDEEYPYLGRR